VERYAETPLPTRWGRFRVVVYRETRSGDPQRHPVEHLAVVYGELGGQGTNEAAETPREGGPSVPSSGQGAILARVHSECLTGEVLGSLKCDCRGQLDAALSRIVDEGRGVVVYLRQEGRGIGLGNKVRAYALQEGQQLDTVEANAHLGLAVDLRSYDVAAAILRDLGVHSVALMTNNPDKIRGLDGAGIRVIERRALWVEASSQAAAYTETKRRKLGHL
jgi:3,4-dihydroxy 2-butanone 4-phosphate synthase/GTP cyclohydrolase II